jgi:hypothetical protein
MIKVSVQPSIYSDILTSMQTGDTPWIAPKGQFYLLDGAIVPLTPHPTVLKLETDRINEIIRIEVVQQNSSVTGIDPRKNQKTYTVIANSSITTVGVQLSRGLNKISVSVLNYPDDFDFLITRATSIVALWEAFARVLYQESFRIIDEQQRAISSKLATRLLEPFIGFQTLLPDLQSLQILATRLVARGLIHTVGTNTGVNELGKALSLTSPVYTPIGKATEDLDLALDPFSKATGGQEAHVWIPNIGITNWLAFIGYISNQPDLFEIVSISEREVAVIYQGELQRHQFDFDAYGTDFLTSLAQSECFKSISILVTIFSEITFPICAASYTFDLYVTADNLLGQCRLNFDSPKPFDTDCLLDADDVDPFTDGWLNLSLTGRFEQDFPLQHVLDTFVIPSTTYTGSTCGYPGYYTQIVTNQKYEVDLPVDIAVSGWVQTSIGWTLQSPDLTKWDIVINHNTGTLLAVSGSSRVVDLFKVVKPDTTEAAFSITNGGAVQTISPPPGGEMLTPTLYIKATDGSVWDVTVNNSNVIKTTKIFPV